MKFVVMLESCAIANPCKDVEARVAPTTQDAQALGLVTTFLKNVALKSVYQDGLRERANCETFKRVICLATHANMTK
jgi:hypothetical protein